MNLVVDEAVEVKQAAKGEPESRRSLGLYSELHKALKSSANSHYIGQILLKGDNVSLIQNVQ